MVPPLFLRNFTYNIHVETTYTDLRHGMVALYCCVFGFGSRASGSIPTCRKPYD